MARLSLNVHRLSDVAAAGAAAYRLFSSPSSRNVGFPARTKETHGHTSSQSPPPS